jgi:hypothetical protein
MNEKVITEVRNCARCGEYHKRIVFHAFKRRSPKYTHWAMCPNVREPILMFIKPPSIFEWISYYFKLLFYNLFKR